MFFTLTLLMLSTAGGGLDTIPPDIGFCGNISGGIFEYAVVRIYSCDSRPFECIYTSGNIAPGGSYYHHAYWRAGEANDNEFYIVECTRYDDHGKIIGLPSIVGNLYWIENFVFSSPNFYNCINDF